MVEYNQYIWMHHVSKILHTGYKMKKAANFMLSFIVEHDSLTWTNHADYISDQFMNKKHAQITNFGKYHAKIGNLMQLRKYSQ